MKKSIALASALAISGASMTVQGAIAQENGAQVSSYDNNGYYCYQVHLDGYIEDLANICTGQWDYTPPAPPAPPPPPVKLSNGNLQCSFQGGPPSRSSFRTGETIKIPAICIALRTTSRASVSAQLKAGSRILDTDVEVISYIEAGETYAYDAEFITDYAANSSDDLLLRFIP